MKASEARLSTLFARLADRVKEQIIAATAEGNEQCVVTIVRCRVDEATYQELFDMLIRYYLELGYRVMAKGDQLTLSW